MTRILLLAFLLPVVWAVEIPPTERSFRFLVVDDNGKPAEGVPIIWIASIENGVNKFGGRTSKEVMRKTLISANSGVVEIPKHQFSFLQVAINTEELEKSNVWMVDSKTTSQSFRWDVYRIDNPHGTTFGPPTPGFDAVFKVLSKQGISNLVRYNYYHDRVPCDGTPTPLRILGGPSAQAKTVEQADVVISIMRPDQEILPTKPGEANIAKPLRVPWVLESKTLRFAHFAPDTDLSADYRHRTWTQRLDIQPTHPDDETSEGFQELRLWAMISGETPLVIPLKCYLRVSFDSRDLGKAVYSVNFEVILPLAPCTRYHPDLVSLAHYPGLAPEISGEAIDALVNPIRAAAIVHAFPEDMKTTPVLRYDTNSTLPWNRRTLPVLLPSDKP